MVSLQPRGRGSGGPALYSGIRGKAHFPMACPPGRQGINTIYALGIIPYKRGTEAPFVQYMHFNPRQFHFAFHFLCRYSNPNAECGRSTRGNECMRNSPTIIDVHEEMTSQHCSFKENLRNIR